MSLKDWVSYSDNDDRDRLLIMSVEFSRSKLEKCIELPEIVCFTSCISILCIIEGAECLIKSISASLFRYNVCSHVLFLHHFLYSWLFVDLLICHTLD